MAKVYPSVAPDEILHGSERSLYVSLRDGLSDDFIVLHSFPWLRPTREQALREGEADFVILHPDKGMLVLEVKGGEVSFEKGQWRRANREGGYGIQDPFTQAQRNMHALLDLLDERRPLGRPWRSAIVYGYAAALPDHRYRGELPHNITRALLLTVDDRADISAWVDGAYACWTSTERLLSLADFAKLEDALLPSFRLFKPHGVNLQEVEERLLLLTHEQQRALEGLYSNDRVLISGVAGSGKTLLALERARSFAQAGARTLLTCYNSALSDWMSEQCQDLESLKVVNFHKLALELIRAAQVDITVRADEPSFWRDEIPAMMQQAIEVLDAVGELVCFDALVVDEAQDFEEEWWFAMMMLLADEDNSPLYIFQDENQRLWDIKEKIPVALPTTFHLKTNCRNTLEIGRLSTELLELPSGESARSPSGPAPKIMVAKERNQQRGLVMQEVVNLILLEKLSPEHIVILGPYTSSKGSLANITDIKGIPVTTEVSSWRSGGGVLVTTAKKFKGLEAQAIIIYDLRALDEHFTVRELYVAITRAKFYLSLFVQTPSLRAELEALSPFHRAKK